ncbi:hypothetical protein QJS66_16910 [Kocuria rhizophila]|nr:hypothetical protein QJS66_16910 [Kocuria rhizophila]
MKVFGSRRTRCAGGGDELEKPQLHGFEVLVRVTNWGCATRTSTARTGTSTWAARGVAG